MRPVFWKPNVSPRGMRERVWAIGAYPARPARSMRLFRGASGRPNRSVHFQCAFAARPTPDIHASTTSVAYS
jgi:hypothetical protein